MTLKPAQHDRARSVFLEALDLPAEERDAHVQSACADDGAVLEEVRSLLAIELGGQGDSDTLDADVSRVGSTISHFRLTSLLASGGMGVVYEAEQDRPRRTVAVKLLRASIPSREALRRFKLETEVLARLRHPAIAQIHEAGTCDEGEGRVAYFAMELVEGARSITRYALDEKLALRTRLELFCVICDAVHHGHQRGVIHRDLKPSNILVDAGGHPKIIDFGVARATDADIAVTTQHTETGSLIGTLQYMSPEQCAADRLDIDTRTDVYSLGVVLYELCCGIVPYDVSTASLVQATRMVCDAPIPPPRTLNRQIRGDLARVILKALERDRARRYQSAAALGEDLQRILRGEPVLARPPGLLTALSRWIVRHPIWTTTLACLSIVAISLGLTLFAVNRYLLSPSDLIVDEPARQARLISRSGNVLKVWQTPKGVQSCSELLHAPDGRRLAVVLTTFGSRSPEASRLEVWDTHDLSAPLWTMPDASAEVTPAPGGNPHASGSYFAGAALVADVFPEHPGPEIITLLRHYYYSPRTIRVLDLDGNVLYEAWHDGGSQIAWLSGPRLIVFAGDSCEHEWPDYGVAGVERPPWMVLALRPALGRHVGWVHGPRREGDPDLAWYKYLLPPETSDLFEFRALKRSPRLEFEAERVSLVLALKEDGTEFAWTIDRAGHVVGEPILTDLFRLKHPDIAPNRDFHFSDTPVPVAEP